MRPLCLVFIFLISLSTKGQSSFTLDLEQGFLFLHSQDVAPIGQSYPSALNVSYNQWLLDSSYWQNCRCFPRVGLGAGYHFYDNPQVLGWGLPVYAFLEPWYKLSDAWYMQIRASLGLIYLSEPYDESQNPLNLSYSLPISAYVSLGLGLGYQWNEHWRFGLQASYDHTSNGGVKEPNKGLNYPMLSLFADHSLDPISFKSGKLKPFDPTKARRRWSLHTAWAAKAGGTVGEGEQEQDVTYLVYGASLRYSHQVSKTSALFGGLDWVSNLAYQKQIQNQGLDFSHHQLSIEAGHEFLLGKFVFSQAAGVYLFKNFGAASDWYQRYLLLYYPWERLGLGPGLKAHAQVAEYLEFRIVWDLWLDFNHNVPLRKIRS